MQIPSAFFRSRIALGYETPCGSSEVRKVPTTEVASNSIASSASTTSVGGIVKSSAIFGGKALHRSKRWSVRHRLPKNYQEIVRPTSD